MNEKEMLDLLAEDAPLPPPDYPLATLKRAQRARRWRVIATGGGTVVVVALLLFGQTVLRLNHEATFPPTESANALTGVVFFFEATEEQRAAVRSTLEQTAGISGVDFVTQEQAFERFAQQFAGGPEFVLSVGPNEFPESYEFITSSSIDRRALLRRLGTMPGVALAKSPNPRLMSPRVTRSPEMGLPEAQVYSEQLIKLAAAQRPAPPKIIHIVDGFCMDDRPQASESCAWKNFSALLRSQLETLISPYAAVDFLPTGDQMNPLAQNEFVATLGPLPSHASANSTLRLQVRTSERTEVAEFAVYWNGRHWIVGPWIGGSLG